MLTIQVETIERRAALGLAVGAVSLDAIADRLRRAVRDGQVPPEIEAVLQAVRARVRASGLGRRDRPADAELDKVLARIQALQGEDRGPRLHRGGGDRGGRARSPSCSTATACRWARSSSRSRPARASGSTPAGAGSGRSTTASRRWARSATAGCGARRRRTAQIRYVFFGLPADVAGARYLYELVERAFATETELFKRSELYAGHRSGERRSATQSFQTGLAHGIARKLA